MSKTGKILIVVFSVVMVLVVAGTLFVVLTQPKDSPDMANGQLSVRENLDQEDLEERLLDKRFIVDAVERGAVCNDGSPAVLYHREALEGSEDKWIVWFEGGGGCSDPETCADRWKTQKYLMTSDTTGNNANKDGILSANPEKNPDFYAWNHVMLNYCSSDSWSGSNVLETDHREWYFSGKQIVASVFEDLSNDSLFDSPISEASEVLITGSSAGGGGVAHNLNEIVDWLPGVKVTGVIDSSWGSGDFETTAYSPEEWNQIKEDRVEYAEDVVDFRNQQLDGACVADNQDNPQACISFEVLQPYWNVPVFIYIDQYDKLKLGNLFENIDEKDQATKEQLADDRAVDVRDSLVGLDGVFSPQETVHVALSNNAFNEILIDGVSFQEALGNWYFDREGPTVLIVE